MPKLAIDPIERRRDERSSMGRYLLRIDACDGSEPITCAIWDISLSGARLSLTQDLKLPAEVNVLIGNVVHRAKVVWQKAGQAGVEFLEPPEF
jgi:hypothetical protein